MVSPGPKIFLSWLLRILVLLSFFRTKYRLKLRKPFLANSILLSPSIAARPFK